MRAAAGGVVWRTSPGGRVEVLLVHRRHRHDWSLPKGGVRRGEPPVDAALREVHEETGLTCAVGPELVVLGYVGRKGRPKETRYWAMTVTGGAFRANDEVDDIRWVDVDDAANTLTYAHELVAVERLGALLSIPA